MTCDLCNVLGKPEASSLSCSCNVRQRIVAKCTLPTMGFASFQQHQGCRLRISKDHDATGRRLLVGNNNMCFIMCNKLQPQALAGLLS